LPYIGTIPLSGNSNVDDGFAGWSVVTRGSSVSIDTMHAERATMRVVDSQSRMRGGADDYHSSGLLWGDAGVDAKLSFARLSSLARGNWGC
jgi:hypothetical protein